MEHLISESNKKPQDEIDMYQRVTKKIDTEYQLIFDERQKLQEELKKLTEIKEELIILMSGFEKKYR